MLILANRTWTRIIISTLRAPQCGAVVGGRWGRLWCSGSRYTFLLAAEVVLSSGNGGSTTAPIETSSGLLWRAMNSVIPCQEAYWTKELRTWQRLRHCQNRKDKSTIARMRSLRCNTAIAEKVQNRMEKPWKDVPKAITGLNIVLLGSAMAVA